MVGWAPTLIHSLIAWAFFGFHFNTQIFRVGPNCWNTFQKKPLEFFVNMYLSVSSSSLNKTFLLPPWLTWSIDKSQKVNSVNVKALPLLPLSDDDFNDQCLLPTYSVILKCLFSRNFLSSTSFTIYTFGYSCHQTHWRRRLWQPGPTYLSDRDIISLHLTETSLWASLQSFLKSCSPAGSHLPEVSVSDNFGGSYYVSLTEWK